MIKNFKTAKIASLLLTIFSAPAIAHNVEISGDIAGTWHIEPDHNPRAGEPAKVWIALTRQGGEVLPLEQANCKLAVYSQPRTAVDQPILQPQLQAIAAEQYQGIPGAEVVFPKPGLYELELGCTPKTIGTFKPFEIQSEATVAAGTTQGSPAPTTTQSPANPVGADRPDETQDSERSNGQKTVFWLVPIVLGLGLLRFLSKRALRDTRKGSPKS